MQLRQSLEPKSPDLDSEGIVRPARDLEISPTPFVFREEQAEAQIEKKEILLLQRKVSVTDRAAPNTGSALTRGWSW